MKALFKWLKERFLTRGTQLDVAKLTENTPMHWAVIYDNTTRLKKCLKDAPKESHQRNRLGFTPYQLASLLGRDACRKLLHNEGEVTIRFQERGAREPSMLTPEAFKERTGVQWTSSLRFPDFETLLAIYLQVEEGHTWRQIDNEAIWLGTYYRRDIEMAREALVTIRWVDEKLGYGVYSDAELKKGSYICEYAGVVRRRPWLSWHISDYCFRYPTAAWTKPIYTIDAEAIGNVGRYFNHSDTPNCEAIGVLSGPLMHILIRTCEPVQAGDELRLDYGPLFWRNRFWQMR